MREGTPIAVEGSAIIGIVQIDGEIIVETEDDASETIARPSVLAYTQRA